MMPELDGYGVIAALRADTETVGIPFIFLTSKGEDPDIPAEMNLAVDDFLTKPVMKPDLLSAIRSRLERKVLLPQRTEKTNDSEREHPARASMSPPGEGDSVLRRGS